MRVMQNFCAVLMAATMWAACGGQEEVLVDEVDAIGVATPAFVRLERDMRKCAYPMCGGYWLRDLNRSSTRRYVSELDLSASGLSDQDVAKVLEAPVEDLVLWGKLGPQEPQFKTRKLLVEKAFRGLPGVSRRAGDAFFQVSSNDPPIQCLVAPCNNNIATRVNTKKPDVAFTGVHVDDVLKSLVETQWLVSRIERHEAVVAGRFEEGQVFAGGPESLLRVSQIYIQLPEQAGPCPLMPIAQCPEGTVNVFARSEDRCEVPAGCVEPGACIALYPVCDEGYTLTSWTGGPFACQVYACDPSFTVFDPNDSRCARVRCMQGHHCVEEGPDACVPDVWSGFSTDFGTQSPYSNNENRRWRIRNTVGGNALRLHFARFDLENGYDFVVIEDTAGTELARYSGALGAFTTDDLGGAEIYLRFTSDSSVVRSGFRVDRVEARGH